MQTHVSAPVDQTKQQQTKTSQDPPQLTSEQQGVFVDNRPEMATYLQLRQLMNNSRQSIDNKALQAMMNNSAQVCGDAGQQAKIISNTPIREAQASQRMPTSSVQSNSQSATATMMPMQLIEEEKTLQTKENRENNIQLETAAEAPKPNNTGLPDNLKTGIESLSGMSMDHVKVHYNSSQPAQLNAHAYAQGSDIHLAPGQEKHLPHEAWHVVQQAQGRVKPTMQMKGSIPVNDDNSLEVEADVMGEKALQIDAMQSVRVEQTKLIGSDPVLPMITGNVQRVAVVQMVKGDDLLIAAALIASNLNNQLLAKNYTKALEHYAELKNAAKDLNQRKSLSSGEDQVFNRHIDGEEKKPGVNRLLKAAIAKFIEVAQTDYDQKVDEITLFVVQKEAQYREAFEKMTLGIVNGQREDAAILQKMLSGAAEGFEKVVKVKSEILKDVNEYKTAASKDTEVQYILEKGTSGGEDRMSAIASSTLQKLSLTKYDVLASKYKDAKKLINENTKKLVTLPIPEAGEISTDTKTKALVLLAGSEERKVEVARILPDSIPNQLKVFAALKPHHSSEDITNVTGYLTDVELVNLDAALSLITLVGGKGSVAEINAFQKAAKAVTGEPALSEIVNFLTGLDYPALSSLTSFITPVGTLCSLTKVREIWELANANKSVETTLGILGEGNIPGGFKASTLDILSAFAKKTGKSKVDDWKTLLDIEGWSLEEVLGLAMGFDSNDGNATAANWAAAAKADVTLKGKPDEVRAQARLNMFASDDWYDKQDVGKLSNTDRAKKKYTQLLYALLGKENLDDLKDIDLDSIRGDFLSSLLFFHKHIASFQSGVGQGFDRGSEEPGTYSRSDKTHPLNKKYEQLVNTLGIIPGTLLQPLNPSLLKLQGSSSITKGTQNGVDYHTGTVGVASAGLPSHNLKNLEQQQLITSKLIANKATSKATYLQNLFETRTLEKSTKASRTIDDKSAVTDELAKKQKAALAGSVSKTGSYDNLHDFLMTDRGEVISKLSTAINAITGGSEKLYAISTEGHPNLVLLCPSAGGKTVKYGGSTYSNTEAILPVVVNDFNGASGQEVKITQRGSFGFQRPTVTDTSESIRIWPGYAPVEALIPGLKAVITKLRNKGSSETLAKLSDLDAITTATSGPVLHIEALKAAMRHAMIVTEEKVPGTATPEKKRVGEWIKTRLLIKLKQSGILIQKGTTIYGALSTATATEKNNHYLITADMTDKLQEYSMIYTAATLVDTGNPNASHTTAGKFKDSNDVYEKRVASKFSGLDYRVYYLDSGEQALVTAGILANRFENNKDENDTGVGKSGYISHNPYFEIGVFKGDARSNLKKDPSGKIVHADLSPVITSGRNTPKPSAEINKEVRETWQNTDRLKTVKHADIIPIIDITNSSLDGVTGLGNMPNNFIIVESLTKHAQLGADKFIMGRLIALSKTAGSSGVISKTNFIDLSQKIVGPVANAAYNPLLAKIRANMDKALYTEQTT
ncbi:DUF4157 domain-containing protein [Cellvibrio sp. NN19]|uniref:eCIS core domain-containing protein n=1 Tax=Cellvibrio chitinivorans TaxID=3102792 RepID=UPI002B415BAA|nr:DUF4157 domain-containing protein [Cellvibrio sp. NN19]